MKKINGIIRYFGRWAMSENGVMVRLEKDGWGDALELYNAQIDDLKREKRQDSESVIATSALNLEHEKCTVVEACNTFLRSKQRKRDQGGLFQRSPNEYNETVEPLTGERFDTVQEKNITHPTDSKLYHKAITKLAAAAKERGVNLRQTFVRAS